MKTKACGLSEAWRGDNGRVICFPSKERKVGSKADLFVDWIFCCLGFVSCLLVCVFFTR